MLRNLEINWENIPILGPLLLQLTNQALWIMVLGGGASFYIWTEEELAPLAAMLFTIVAVLAGMRQWRDARVAIENNKGLLIDVTETLLSQEVEIPTKFGTITLDMPDELEGPIANAIYDAVLKLVPDEES